MRTVSVLINNFNYARYVGHAIDSALGQVYPATDVIVVDDGSTDESRSVLEKYGNAITTIFKENGGQASAFNAGFRASHGDIVVFLDADDILLPSTVSRIVDRFEQNDRISRVCYRLEVVDAKGKPTGAFRPPLQVKLPNGDLRDEILVNPHDIGYSPTSGNAFSAEVLRRLMPIPEEPWRISADTYLLNLSPLLGPVAALDDVGGHYRVHGDNTYHTPTMSLERVRDVIERTKMTNAEVARLAHSLGFVDSPSNIRLNSVTDLAQRLMSLRLEPERHPIGGDRRISLAVAGIMTTLRRRQLAALHRVLYCAWFVAVATLPQFVARPLSERLFLAWDIGGRAAVFAARGDGS